MPQKNYVTPVGKTAEMQEHLLQWQVNQLWPFFQVSVLHAGCTTPGCSCGSTGQPRIIDGPAFATMDN